MAESALLKYICDNNGSTDFENLVVNNFGSLNLNTARDQFHVVNFNGRKMVIAKTKVRLCKARECENCNNLHLCKFYLYGHCKNSMGRRRCRFGHDLNSEHNAKVLMENNLQDLDKSELCTLLLQNDNTLLPPVCFSYNKGSGEYGNCPDQESCRRLHICDKYLRGTCQAGGNCLRSHDFFEPHPMKTLQERGVPNELIGSMVSVYQNIQAMKNQTTTNKHQSTRHDTHTGSSVNRPDIGHGNSQEKTEICIYYVRGSCKFGGNEDFYYVNSTKAMVSAEQPNEQPRHTSFCTISIIHALPLMGDECRRAHCNMPYLWEVRNRQGWSALPNTEEIEKDYCDPSKTYSQGFEPVCFDTMTQGLFAVRRLSTVSSVVLPTFVLTTEWAWYWEDEYGKWTQYASSNGTRGVSSITSEDLEQKYLENAAAVVQFSAGSQTYELRFQDMVQINQRYGTKKLVRRRPVFVSSVDAQRIKTSKKPPHKQPNFKAMPAHWDKTKIPDTGYQKVAVSSGTSEYKEILGLFRSTMVGFTIKQMDRIQNKALWEVFQWQRDLMRKSNAGRNITEKMLFHGTDSRHIEAICLQNFDWRICGTHGTAYGKGSYFARDANYSHSYTDSSGIRTMFVCRVLVGHFTKGNSSYLRPPSKDGGDALFYDSCVDDVYNPSIFVVFEKHQVYPEYIIQYYEDACPPSVHYYTPAPSRPAPRPKPIPTPIPTPRSTPRPTPTYDYYSNSSAGNNRDNCVIL